MESARNVTLTVTNALTLLRPALLVLSLTFSSIILVRSHVLLAISRASIHYANPVAKLITVLSALTKPLNVPLACLPIHFPTQFALFNVLQASSIVKVFVKNVILSLDVLSVVTLLPPVLPVFLDTFSTTILVSRLVQLVSSLKTISVSHVTILYLTVLNVASKLPSAVLVRLAGISINLPVCLPVHWTISLNLQSVSPVTLKSPSVDHVNHQPLSALLVSLVFCSSLPSALLPVTKATSSSLPPAILVLLTVNDVTMASSVLSAFLSSGFMNSSVSHLVPPSPLSLILPLPPASLVILTVLLVREHLMCALLAHPTCFSPNPSAIPVTNLVLVAMALQTPAQPVLMIFFYT